MLAASEVISALETCGFTHVVWIPDSHLGTWESALLTSHQLRLIRAAREGEAIAIAGGLLLGGARPLVVIQCTGLFEAGDALRNVVHDLKLPLLMIVGVRSYRSHLEGKTSDNCPTFTEPIVKAWQIPYHWIDPEKQNESELIGTLREMQRSNEAEIVLWSE